MDKTVLAEAMWHTKTQNEDVCKAENCFISINITYCKLLRHDLAFSFNKFHCDKVTLGLQVNTSESGV